MAKVMEAKPLDASALAEPPPCRLEAVIGEWIALPLYSAIAGPCGDIGKYMRRVISLERP